MRCCRLASRGIGRWFEAYTGDVRFELHKGLKADITPGLKVLCRLQGLGCGN
jgi:hypothetical protein